MFRIKNAHVVPSQPLCIGNASFFVMGALVDVVEFLRDLRNFNKKLILCKLPHRGADYTNQEKNEKTPSLWTLLCVPGAFAAPA